MDYDKFRFRAVVDWLEIEITTAKPTNFPTIRRKGSLCFVAPLDATAGGAASRFRFRIYDPESWAEIRQIVANIEQAAPFATLLQITGIEVSFDAYSKGASRDQLVTLAANFFLFNTAVVSDNKRIAGRWKGDTEGIPNQAAVRRKIAAGRVVVIGNTGDPIGQRCYFKTTDHNGQAIPNERDHRARIEVTLQGDAVPMKTLDLCDGYRFEGLAEFFKFRAIKDDLDPVTKAAVEFLPRIGKRQKRNRREGGTRLYSKTTRADTALNRKAYDALRELTRRMSKP